MHSVNNSSINNPTNNNNNNNNNNDNPNELLNKNRMTSSYYVSHPSPPNLSHRHHHHPHRRRKHHQHQKYNYLKETRRSKSVDNYIEDDLGSVSTLLSSASVMSRDNNRKYDFGLFDDNPLYSSSSNRQPFIPITVRIDDGFTNPTSQQGHLTEEQKKLFDQYANDDVGLWDATDLIFPLMGVANAENNMSSQQNNGNNNKNGNNNDGIDNNKVVDPIGDFFPPGLSKSMDVNQSSFYSLLTNTDRNYNNNNNNNSNNNNDNNNNDDNNNNNNGNDNGNLNKGNDRDESTLSNSRDNNQFENDQFENDQLLETEAEMQKHKNTPQKRLSFAFTPQSYRTVTSFSTFSSSYTQFDSSSLASSITPKTGGDLYSDFPDVFIPLNLSSLSLSNPSSLSDENSEPLKKVGNLIFNKGDSLLTPPPEGTSEDVMNRNINNNVIIDNNDFNNVNVNNDNDNKVSINDDNPFEKEEDKVKVFVFMDEDPHSPHEGSPGEETPPSTVSPSSSPNKIRLKRNLSEQSTTSLSSVTFSENSGESPNKVRLKRHPSEPSSFPSPVVFSDSCAGPTSPSLSSVPQVESEKLPRKRLGKKVRNIWEDNSMVFSLPSGKNVPPKILPAVMMDVLTPPGDTPPSNAVVPSTATTPTMSSFVSNASSSPSHSRLGGRCGTSLVSANKSSPPKEEKNLPIPIPEAAVVAQNKNSISNDEIRNVSKKEDEKEKILEGLDAIEKNAEPSQQHHKPPLPTKSYSAAVSSNITPPQTVVKVTQKQNVALSNSDFVYQKQSKQNNVSSPSVSSKFTYIPQRNTSEPVSPSPASLHLSPSSAFQTPGSYSQPSSPSSQSSSPASQSSSPTTRFSTPAHTSPALHPFLMDQVRFPLKEQKNECIPMVSSEPELSPASIPFPQPGVFIFESPSKNRSNFLSSSASNASNTASSPQLDFIRRKEEQKKAKKQRTPEILEEKLQKAAEFREKGVNEMREKIKLKEDKIREAKENKEKHLQDLESKCKSKVNIATAKRERHLDQIRQNAHTVNEKVVDVVAHHGESELHDREILELSIHAKMENAERRRHGFVEERKKKSKKYFEVGDGVDEVKERKNRKRKEKRNRRKNSHGDGGGGEDKKSDESSCVNISRTPSVKSFISQNSRGSRNSLSKRNKKLRKLERKQEEQKKKKEDVLKEKELKNNKRIIKKVDEESRKTPNEKKSDELLSIQSESSLSMISGDSGRLPLGGGIGRFRYTPCVLALDDCLNEEEEVYKNDEEELGKSNEEGIFKSDKEELGESNEEESVFEIEIKENESVVENDENGLVKNNKEELKSDKNELVKNNENKNIKDGKEELLKISEDDLKDLKRSVMEGEEKNEEEESMKTGEDDIKGINQSVTEGKKSLENDKINYSKEGKDGSRLTFDELVRLKQWTKNYMLFLQERNRIASLLINACRKIVSEEKAVKTMVNNNKEKAVLEHVSPRTSVYNQNCYVEIQPSQFELNNEKIASFIEEHTIYLLSLSSALLSPTSPWSTKLTDLSTSDETMMPLPSSATLLWNKFVLCLRSIVEILRRVKTEASPSSVFDGLMIDYDSWVSLVPGAYIPKSTPNNKVPPSVSNEIVSRDLTLPFSSPFSTIFEGLSNSSSSSFSSSLPSPVVLPPSQLEPPQSSFSSLSSSSSFPVETRHHHKTRGVCVDDQEPRIVKGDEQMWTERLEELNGLMKFELKKERFKNYSDNTSNKKDFQNNEGANEERTLASLFMEEISFCLQEDDLKQQTEQNEKSLSEPSASPYSDIPHLPDPVDLSTSPASPTYYHCVSPVPSPLPYNSILTLYKVCHGSLLIIFFFNVGNSSLRNTPILSLIARVALPIVQPDLSSSSELHLH
jgi:hypothetical protein